MERKTNKEKQIDTLVDMLDNFFENEGGHINVKVDKTNDKIDLEKVEIEKNPDCINGACKTPTLFEGLDEKEGE